MLSLRSRLVLSILIALLLSPVVLSADSMPSAEAAAPLAAPQQNSAPSIEEEARLRHQDDPLARLRRDLQSMERHLRFRLLEMADDASSGRPAAARIVDETDRLRDHLRAMEDGFLHLVGDLEPAQVATWVRKVKALEPLVGNLERALVHPESAAGLTGLRRALEVEWPPAASLLGTVNDNCVDAIPIGDGTFFGSTLDATPDGEGCFSGSPDIWFAYTAPATTEVIADTFGSGFDTVISVYTGCPGTLENEITCDDDTFGSQSAIRFQAQAGETYLLRVAGCCGDGGSVGPVTLNVGPGGVIAGQVTDETTGDPLASVDLAAFNSDGLFVGSAITDSEGNYQIAGLISGNYVVFTREFADYLQEIYDDVACHDFGCDPADGTPIAVVSGQTTGGIDFGLRRGGTIAGHVTERTTGNPPPGFSVRVNLYDPSGNFLREAFVDGSGEYEFSGLAPATYFVVATSFEYLDQLYDDLACPGGLPGGCELEDGQPVEVDFETTTGGIDFAMDRLGAISGALSDAATGFPVSSASIYIWNDRGDQVGGTSSFSDGTYVAGALRPGNYFVTTESHPYFDELFDDLPCEPSCDPTIGMPVEVGLNQTTPGIDFELTRLGAIAGSVTERTTGNPIKGARATAWNDQGNLVRSVSVSSTGAYVLENLPPGNYTVTVQDDHFQGELYDDMPCPGRDCDPTQGTPIAVELNAVTGDIDFELERLGAISGQVTHAQTGEPLAGIDIVVFNADGFEVGGYFNETDSSGHYFVQGLEPGNHFVVARDFEYFDEVYDGLPCERGCDATSGTPVQTELNTVTAGIDFGLDRLGEITGRVVSAQTGEPLEAVLVSLYDASGDLVENDFVLFSGEYSFQGLQPGTYFAIGGGTYYANELYEEIPCATGCDPTTGTPISVDLNRVISDIDFTVELLGAISGRVVFGEEPVDDAVIYLYDSSGDLRSSTSTEPNGSYRIEHVLPGTFFATAVHRQHEDILYDGIPCDGGCDVTTGTPINVSIDTTTSGIDFNFAQEGSIAGRVTYAGQPLSDAQVAIYDSTGLAQLRVSADAFGDYLAEGLEAGTYFAVAEHPQLDDELYDNLPCDDGCDPTAGAPIDVDAGEVTGAIDFALGYCTPTATSLCLTGDRFRVEATWTDFENDTGLGQAEQLTADSGYFWFFSPSNIELVVKVLNACTDFNHFWVFGAGLTDVGVELTITDGLTGEVRPYSNPLGTKYAPITDTSAFPTCDAMAQPPVESTVALPARETSEPKLAEPKLTDVAELAEMIGSGTLKMAGLEKMQCVPSETGLCLNEGRFLVEAQWRTREGNTGSGQAIPLTGDTGYYWFFSPDNVEVMVKVLDACELDGFNNFWVFAAGLTDVEVTLTVTDTVSGEVQEYFNPLGTPFEAITDTDAFDTCDS